MNMKILWLPSFSAMSVECMLQPLRLAGQLSSRCVSACTSRGVLCHVITCSAISGHCLLYKAVCVSETQRLISVYILVGV